MPTVGLQFLSQPDGEDRSSGRCHIAAGTPEGTDGVSGRPDISAGITEA